MLRGCSSDPKRLCPSPYTQPKGQSHDKQPCRLGAGEAVWSSFIFFFKSSSANKIAINIVGFETYPKNLGLVRLENEVFAMSLLSFLPGCLLEA